ncbi:MAG: LegC family aminotransferase [Elusimicrobiota bacterium]
MNDKKNKHIPLSVPFLVGDESERVKECFDTGWVSTVGPQVTQFENEFSKLVNSPFSVAMSSGTAALHVALRAVNVQSGDLVLVSNLTFVAPAFAIKYCGADPIFIDANKKDWQMDVSELKNFLKMECELKAKSCVHKKTGRTIRALIPVHILGLACDIESIVEVAHEFHLAVVEDTAEGLGVKVNGKMLGTFGDIGIYSFNGNKIITAGGGGMLVTSDSVKAKKARYLSTQAKDDEIEYVHNDLGYNYRLNSLQAALGRAQLSHLEKFIEKKRKISRKYTEKLKVQPSIGLMPQQDNVSTTDWLYTVLLPDSITLDQRKKLILDMRAQGVESRPLWHPLYSLPVFKSPFSSRMPVSDELYRRAVSLPSSIGLSNEDQDIVINVFLNCLNSL